ncbi:glycosyltransferase [Leptospira sp. 2 VSF19]|uniref:Glycosyltransferase n=1 Tax=Leptospira soteropolitanensis TaxID=2950025 RepID=A0AAW5VKD7_9LEPT|nr:glycosyltransferase family 2 protein [Leptospira soteropolitanensis]MCW7493193.1 glycosyltransferase [Leptospira soteropolitanensis]MCW7500738.1 glycosyltransferase [Leptospira soteropolitanensis]MCW7523043.1 glycosyltransferase [Leptospira soteropolitanensis]MCW7526850.1 glycosyltransferase [Leptospira soteropolitanensis]MCW7530761.1 glycosyltransferase [Leptospira soteropolitanensis]
MKSIPLVTVITVVRNAEKTIQRTLVSALEQKNVSLEIIVWDGLSTDGTLKQIEKYRRQLTIVSQRDFGVYDAMNQALKIANGKWILFLNADDYFLSSDSLSLLLSEVGNTEFDYVCGCATLFFGLKKWPPKTLTDIDYFLGNPSNHQTYLCKKKVYDHLGGFNTQYKYAADVDFMYRVIQAGYKGLPVFKSIVNYSLGGLSSKNISAGVDELDKIRSNFLNSDLVFARESRLVFQDGLEFSEQFKSEVFSRKLSKTQKRFLDDFFKFNKSIESTSFIELNRKRFVRFMKNIAKKFVFFILKFIPSRYI